MAEKVKNGNEKLKLMLDTLKKADGNPVTTSELMEILQCNRNSVNGYYKKCLLSGNAIKKMMVGHETGYCIEMGDNTYEPMTADIVRKFLIMQRMVPGSENKKTLIGLDALDVEEKEEICKLTGVKTVSKYYELVDELEREGEIIRIDDKYYPAGKGIPIARYIDEDVVNQYLNILSLMPPGHHCQKQIASIYEKIYQIYQGDEKADDTYVVLGKGYPRMNRIRSLLEVLSTVDYIHKPIHIVYQGSKNNNVEYILVVGLVCYCVEKDKLYVIGKKCGSGAVIKDKPATKNSPKDLTVFLDVEKIISVKEENGANKSYHSRYFMDIYNRMFSVGNSRDIENGKIAVAFTNEEYIKERLLNLCEYRKKSGARIEEHEDCIVYRDMIEGLDDFFNFLRQFTGKYRILNSELLSKKKEKSLQLTITKYYEDRP